MSKSCPMLKVEVLVIGGGPAGMASACEAAEAGHKVAVLDNSPWLGGQIWRGEQTHPSLKQAQQWLLRFKNSGAVAHLNTTAFAAVEPRIIQADTPAGPLQIAWKKLIIATGARERFLPFPGWTLPGIMGPGGLHAMAKSGWPVDGKRVIIAGTGPLLLAAAAGLKQHGAKILRIVEQSPFLNLTRFSLGMIRHPGKLTQGIEVMSRLLGVPYSFEGHLVKAEEAPGHNGRLRITFRKRNDLWTEECDILAAGFHLIPNVEWPLHLGCAVEDGYVRVNEYQQTSLPDVYSVGETTGIGGADRALITGRIAGLAAAGKSKAAQALFPERNSWEQFRERMDRTFSLSPDLKKMAQPDTIVCRCEDVRHHELQAHSDWRASKLHTRCGMGACQGRVCGGATQFLFGWKNESVRMPVLPVGVGALLCQSAGAEQKTDAETSTNKG